MQHSIFISYRRDDSEGEAGRLYDDLVRASGKDAVFMDVAGIAPGLDFRKAIDDNVAGCGVFLAVIGTQWTTIADADGKRRLDDANDFVRLEVASALARNIAVIPVLVHEARMPRPDQLPDNIKDLAYRNSVEISHARWDSDVKLLIDALRQYVTTSAATETQPVHATVPVQLPPPVTPHASPPPKKPNLPLIAGGGIAALLVLAGIGFALFHKSTPQPAPAAANSGGTAGTTTPTSTATASALAGYWRNTGADREGSPVELHITGANPRYRVDVLASCPQGTCSWGTQTVNFDGVQGVAAWSPRATPDDEKKNRGALVTFRPDGDQLHIQIQNTFTVNGQTTHKTANLDFVRVK